MHAEIAPLMEHYEYVEFRKGHDLPAEFEDLEIELLRIDRLGGVLVTSEHAASTAR